MMKRKNRFLGVPRLPQMLSVMNARKPPEAGHDYSIIEEKGLARNTGKQEQPGGSLSHSPSEHEAAAADQSDARQQNDNLCESNTSLSGPPSPEHRPSWLMNIIQSIRNLGKKANVVETTTVRQPSVDETSHSSMARRTKKKKKRRTNRAHREAPAQSPRRVEEGAVHSQAGAAEDETAKFQKHVAFGLLTFNAGTLIAVKVMIIVHKVQVVSRLTSTVFVATSVFAWFVSLSCALVVVLLHTFERPSKNLTNVSMICNSVGTCVMVVGIVIFWSSVY